MTDVKSVIALLCKHLKLSFNVNIRPEHFRLSKFDKTEDNSVCQMWEILYKICKELLEHLIEDDVVTTVKMCFAMLGYRCLDFYCLPPDMSNGSRELLLALGWLLITQNVLENSVSKALRIHKGSINASNLPHLSVSETNLVQNPEMLSAYLGQVNNKISLIETHKQWGKKCHIFWEWMESVIAEKESKADMNHISVEEKKTLFAVLDALRNKIKSVLLKYQRLTSESAMSEEDIENVPQTIQGMPRCIRQPKEKDTDMARLLLESEQQLQDVQKQYEQKEAVMKLQLHEIAKRMEHAVVLFPQELK
ncbi:hypothetical protein C0J52_05963 [Blattella germanica]|nr:hypothetical protein C0J52_05963 [Blattella germanica]